MNFKRVLRVFYGLLYVAAGINHFVQPEFYLAIMPPYIPAHELMVALSGVAEVLLGIGLIVKRSQRLAAWGIIALLLAVFPANVHMMMNSEQFDVPLAALIVRLPIQGLLIWWAWLYTRVPAASA